MPKNENRLNRINEELKKEISNVISFELKNPNVTGLISSIQRRPPCRGQP